MSSSAARLSSAGFLQLTQSSSALLSNPQARLPESLLARPRGGILQRKWSVISPRNAVKRKLKNLLSGRQAVSCSPGFGSLKIVKIKARRSAGLVQSSKIPAPHHSTPELNNLQNSRRRCRREGQTGKIETALLEHKSFSATTTVQKGHLLTQIQPLTRPQAA